MVEAAEPGSQEILAPHERDALVRSARFALESVRREYPYAQVHVLRADEDARPPREQTPAFANAFDWHSSVHGHWTLVRALRLGACPDPAAAEETLDLHLAAGPLEGERAHLEAPGREGFERPYGLAWLLQLCAELREWEDARAARWLAPLAPLEELAGRRIAAWLPKLPWPIRSGEHSQSAFAMGLAFDWARVARSAEVEGAVTEAALRLHLGDREAAVHLEPSGYDFLSPTLGVADLMRRVLAPVDYPEWLRGFLPKLDSEAATRWLQPVVSPDRSDGKLAHLDGLNLSRAWMLDGVVAALDASAPVAAILERAAARHRAAGLAGLETSHYAGTHWLGSFAAYLVTRRGRTPPRIA